MTNERTLSPDEIGHLKRAGEWRLLRSLAGHKVCMTGKMSMTRTQLATLVEAAGGVFTNAMSGTVTMLIVADDSVWSGKIEKAEAAGTLCVRETDFAAELLPTPAELLSGSQSRYGDPR